MTLFSCRGADRPVFFWVGFPPCESGRGRGEKTEEAHAGECESGEGSGRKAAAAAAAAAPSSAATAAPMGPRGGCKGEDRTDKEEDGPMEAAVGEPTGEERR